MKSLDWTKITSPFPVKELDKGQITRTPLDQAYGNGKDVVAPKLNYQPIPLQVILPREN